MTEISARGTDQNSFDDSKEVSPSNLLEAEDNYYKMFLKDYANDCMYFDKEVDFTSQLIKETNKEIPKH
ncbi:5508_t:CDS:1, partial [Funneliformis mosseae]